MCRLEAHTDTVATVAATSALAATGGWDHAIHLWRWPQLLTDAATGDLAASATAKRSAPEATDAADVSAPAVSTGGHDAVITDSAAALQGHAQVCIGMHVMLAWYEGPNWV